MQFTKNILPGKDILGVYGLKLKFRCFGLSRLGLFTYALNRTYYSFWQFKWKNEKKRQVLSNDKKMGWFGMGVFLVVIQVVSF